jgi:hypothetical protein
MPGSIDFESGTVTFQPFKTVTSPVTPPNPPVGDYTLQLLDMHDNIVQEIPFEPSVLIVDDGTDTKRVFLK